MAWSAAIPIDFSAAIRMGIAALHPSYGVFFL
jgi:hypothetical protein